MQLTSLFRVFDSTWTFCYRHDWFIKELFQFIWWLAKLIKLSNFFRLSICFVLYYPKFPVLFFFQNFGFYDFFFFLGLNVKFFYESFLEHIYVSRMVPRKEKSYICMVLLLAFIWFGNKWFIVKHMIIIYISVM